MQIAQVSSEENPSLQDASHLNHHPEKIQRKLDKSKAKHAGILSYKRSKYEKLHDKQQL